MAQERISIEIVADDRGLQATLKRAGVLLRELSASTDDLDNGLRRSDKSIHKFAQGLRGIVLDLNLARHAVMGFQFAVLDLVNPIIKSGAMFERTTALMEGMSKAADEATSKLEAQANVAFMLQKATSNPFGIKALQDSMVKLKSIGFDPTNGSLAQFNEELRTLQKEGKYATEGVAINMQNLLDAVANFGGSEEQLKRASVAIQQMAGKGVISMEELRQQLGEAVPNAVQLLADSLNLTYGELVKYISEGKVKAEPAILAMFREMEIRMGGSAARMMETWDGMVAQFQTSFEVFKNAIFDSGFGDALKEQMSKFTEWMASPEGISAAQNIGKILGQVVNILAAIVRFMIEWGEEIKNVAVAFIGIKVFAPLLTKIVVSLTAIRGIQMGEYFKNMAERLAVATLELQRAPTAMTRFSTAARQLGIVLTTSLGGPLAIAAGLLASFGLSWWAETEAIEANTEALIANREEREMTQDDLESLKNAKRETNALWEEQVKIMLEAELQLKKYQKEREAGKGTTVNFFEADREFQAAKQESERLVARLTEIDASIEKARQDNIERGARTITGAYEKQISTLERSISKQADIALGKLYEERDKLISSGQDASAKVAEIERLADGERKARYDKMLSFIDGEIKQQKAIMDASRDAELKAQRQHVIDWLAEKKRQAQQAREFTPVDWLTAGSKNNQGQVGMDPLVARYNSLQRKLAGMQAEITAWESGQTNLNKELAITNALIEIQVKDVKEVTHEQVRGISQTADMTKEKHALLSKWLNDYDEQMLGATQAQREFDAMLAYGDNWKKMSQNSRELALGLMLVGESGGKAKERLEEIFAASRFADGIKALTKDVEDLNDAFKKWTSDSLSEADKRDASYQEDIARILEIEAALKRNLSYTEDLQNKVNAAIHGRTAIYMRESRGVIGQWVDDFKGATESLKEAFTGWMDDASSAFADFIVTGKNGWREFRDGVLRDIANIIMKKAIVGLVDSAIGAFGSATPPSVPMPNETSINPAGVPDQGWLSDYLSSQGNGFANGGVMTSKGSIPLRKYSNGGVAKKPQLALFGEGRTPEAYVPLPDGRTIPVSIKDGMKQSGANVTFNLINQSGQQVSAEQGPVRFDGEQMIMDVVLKNIQKPGKFREGMKSGVRT